MRVETIVVGASHMGLAAMEACLALGEDAPLILVREPYNPHDANAVLLLDIFGRPVGYIQRSVAAEVAQWMDAGAMVTGKIVRRPNLRLGRMRMRLRYPRAVIFRTDPPKEVTEKHKRKKVDA